MSGEHFRNVITGSTAHVCWKSYTARTEVYEVFQDDLPNDNPEFLADLVHGDNGWERVDA